MSLRFSWRYVVQGEPVKVLPHYFDGPDIYCCLLLGGFAYHRSAEKLTSVNKKGEQSDLHSYLQSSDIWVVVNERLPRSLNERAEIWKK